MLPLRASSHHLPHRWADRFIFGPTMSSSTQSRDGYRSTPALDWENRMAHSTNGYFSANGTRSAGRMLSSAPVKVTYLIFTVVSFKRRLYQKVLNGGRRCFCYDCCRHHWNL